MSKVVTYIGQDGIKILPYNGWDILEVYDEESPYYTNDLSKMKLEWCPFKTVPIQIRSLCFDKEKFHAEEEIEAHAKEYLGEYCYLVSKEEHPLTKKETYIYESYVAFCDELSYLRHSAGRDPSKDYADNLKQENSEMKKIIKYMKYGLVGSLAFIIGLVIASIFSGGLV